ncbi:MAG: NAD(P)/FAD-dependent oxidoreductase [Halobacteriota archaeon]|nr:NAD(P)/FAD-dependent oxidoreductase [Halobacteriota archaeon]
MKKISIIGGSIAGLTTALQLMRLDETLDVTVFEDHPEVGEPVRSAEGFIDIHDVGEPPDECICMKVDEIVYRFNFKDSPSKIFKVEPSVGFWLIDRTKYEKMLADQCTKVGVEIKTGHRASLDKIQSLSDIIVDASGADYDSGFFSVQYTVRDDFTYHMNKALFEFRPDMSGYFWILPKGPDLANVGFCSTKKEDQSEEEMERLLKEYMYAKIIHGEVISKISGYIGAVIRDRLYNEGKDIIYVGDAAGLANPVNGERISSAIFSGKMAAEAIVNDTLNSYQKNVLSELKPNYQRMVRRIWDKYGYITFSNIMIILAGAMTGETVDRKNVRKIIFRKPLRKMFIGKPGIWLRFFF